jgi:hypothetical protein
MIDEWWLWKILEGRGHSVIKLFMEEMKKSVKYLSQIRRVRPTPFRG